MYANYQPRSGMVRGCLSFFSLRRLSFWFLLPPLGSLRYKTNSVFFVKTFVLLMPVASIFTSNFYQPRSSMVKWCILIRSQLAFLCFLSFKFWLFMIFAPKFTLIWVFPRFFTMPLQGCVKTFGYFCPILNIWRSFMSNFFFHYRVILNFSECYQPRGC